jgi:hypothetical protein
MINNSRLAELVYGCIPIMFPSIFKGDIVLFSSLPASSLKYLESCVPLKSRCLIIFIFSACLLKRSVLFEESVARNVTILL